MDKDDVVLLAVGEGAGDRFTRLQSDGGLACRHVTAGRPCAGCIVAAQIHQPPSGFRAFGDRVGPRRHVEEGLALPAGQREGSGRGDVVGEVEADLVGRRGLLGDDDRAVGAKLNVPMSSAKPNGRVFCRWLVVSAVSPASMAGLPVRSVWVWVGPPLSAKGPSFGSTPTMLWFTPLTNPQPDWVSTRL